MDFNPVKKYDDLGKAVDHLDCVISILRLYEEDKLADETYDVLHKIDKKLTDLIFNYPEAFPEEND